MTKSTVCWRLVHFARKKLKFAVNLEGPFRDSQKYARTNACMPICHEQDRKLTVFSKICPTWNVAESSHPLTSYSISPSLNHVCLIRSVELKAIRSTDQFLLPPFLSISIVILRAMFDHVPQLRSTRCIESSLNYEANVDLFANMQYR